MRVIMFSADASIVRDGSPAFLRAQEYRALFDELHVMLVTGFVSLLRSFFKASEIIKKDPRAFVVSSQEEFTGLVALLLKIRFRIPWQAQIHTDPLSPYYTKVFFKNRIRKIIFLMTIRHASSIRVVGERVKVGLRARGVRVPITVLPIYTDLAKLQATPRKQNPADPTILMISRLTHEKNISLALRACAKLAHGGIGFETIIVGDGPLRAQLEVEARQLGIAERVRFEGWQKNIEKYFSVADIFLATSWYEGYGLGVVEAMAVGICVIASNVGVAGDLLKDQKSGLIYEPGDEKKLAQLLERAVSDFGLRVRLGTAALRAVQHMPSKETYLAEFKKSFEVCKN